MPFNFLGTMRQCQWKAFRDWTLNERRSVSARLRVIDAELRRLGRITVFYKRQVTVVQTREGAEQEVENVTEEREAFVVSPGSTLEKLVQAYIAQGGNPMSISLWLQPDDIQFTTDEDPDQDPDSNPNEAFTRQGAPSTPYDQPGGGIAAPQSTDSYGPGGQYPGGLSNLIRDPTKMAGRYFDQGSAGSKIAIRLDFGRRWVAQNLGELTRLENRIMKIMDLREQLMNERDTLVQQAVGGSVADFPEPPDSDRYARNLSLPVIVTEMDRTFYELDENGEPDFSTVNLGRDLGNGQADPSGISFYDTLFADPPGTDPYAHG
jgi:hypothetical protein